jgi:hypothetical protein
MLLKLVSHCYCYVQLAALTAAATAVAVVIGAALWQETALRACMLLL